MKNRKRILKFTIVAGLALSLCLGSIGGASGNWATIDVLQNDINVVVNNRQITADNFLYNDTTYLPMRAIGEALGVPVGYDGESNTAYVGANNYYGYAEKPWCPDFGFYVLDSSASVVPLEEQGYMYFYHSNRDAILSTALNNDKLQEYLDMLHALGFRVANSAFACGPTPTREQSITMINGNYMIDITFDYDDELIVLMVLDW